MPRVGEVDGVQIFVQDETNAKHKRPHFHARGSGWAASIALDNFEIIRGELPRNKRRAVLDYAKRYGGALREAYDTVQAGFAPEWIK